MYGMTQALPVTPSHFPSSLHCALCLSVGYNPTPYISRLGSNLNHAPSYSITPLSPFNFWLLLTHSCSCIARWHGQYQKWKWVSPIHHTESKTVNGVPTRCADRSALVLMHMPTATLHFTHASHYSSYSCLVVEDYMCLICYFVFCCAGLLSTWLLSICMPPPTTKHGRSDDLCIPHHLHPLTSKV